MRIFGWFQVPGTIKKFKIVKGRTISSLRDFPAFFFPPPFFLWGYLTASFTVLSTSILFSSSPFFFSCVSPFLFTFFFFLFLCIHIIHTARHCSTRVRSWKSQSIKPLSPQSAPHRLDRQEGGPPIFADTPEHFTTRPSYWRAWLKNAQAGRRVEATKLRGISGRGERASLSTRDVEAFFWKGLALHTVRPKFGPPLIS